MKIYQLTFFIPLFFFSLINAQVYTGPSNVKLTTQAEVDAFGANGYKEIRTAIRIEGDNISNINALSSIEVIEFSLTISNNKNLESLSGLDNLRVIGLSFVIENNDKLINLVGLGSIESVGKVILVNTINITKNDNLQSLDGINPDMMTFDSQDAFQRVDFYLSHNKSLFDISALGNYKELSWLYIEYCPSLENLNGLETVEFIGNSIFLQYNEKLTDCSAICELYKNNPNKFYIYGNYLDCFENRQFEEACMPNGKLNITLSTQEEVDDFAVTYNDINQISGYLQITRRIDNLDPITNLGGISNLETVGDDLIINNTLELVDLTGLNAALSQNANITISRNHKLTDTEALNTITAIEVENIRIFENTELQTLSGIESLEVVDKKFDIFDNPKLITGDSFDNLTRIKELSIQNNPELESLSMFGNLTVVTSNLLVNNNSSLSSMNGLDTIDEISDLVISRNEGLQNLEGLNSLTKLGSLDIYLNDNLTSLLGIYNVTNTTKRPGLRIIESNGLINLHGLENFTSTELLVIRDNKNLKSLEGLNNIININVNGPDVDPLTIWNNKALTDLCAISNLVENDTYSNIKDEDIQGNAYNPTIAEIIDSSTCSALTLSSSLYDSKSSGITITPNPTSNTLNFSNTIGNLDLKKINIYTISGKKVVEYSDTTSIDISYLKSGIFLVKIETDQGTFMQKVIKN